MNSEHSQGKMLSNLFLDLLRMAALCDSSGSLLIDWRGGYRTCKVHMIQQALDAKCQQSLHLVLHDKSLALVFVHLFNVFTEEVHRYYVCGTE